METNKERLEKLETIESDKLDKKLKAIAWTILIFTVISIIVLAITTGILSYKEMAEGMGIAGIPLSLKYALALFIATLISMGIVTALVAIFFWKPMKENLKVRKDNIATNIEAANYTKKVAEANWAEAKAEKAKIKAEAKDILSTAKQNAEKERKAILDKAKVDMDLAVERNRKDIEAEKEQLKDDIRNEILSTSLLAAEKILEKEINSDANNKMINELLDSLK